ncbi:MACPF domain-containing protein At4g24290-like [Impatiens glandulifera]|uniref:MACPF domain-containing protein At4g24290-like n=1 Tax=Impatiens glandulifera TaxID=253017 RepID=UPI001FB054AC|nr:MACPF domain-containing protein At4g24290-like [Impatiens glandulifera]
MENSIHVAAIEALGYGFDLTSDFRLKFAKSCPHGGRLVELDETTNKRDIVIPGSALSIPDVPEAIGCDKGDRVRFKSDVLEFNQMSRLFNQKSSLQGKVPSGYLNSLFDLTGSWLNDREDTKFLAFDGYFISLCYLHLKESPLILRENVKKAVPSYWDPLSLSRFIETYGTHIIVGMTVGGQDLVCVKQRASSSIPPSELRGYLEDIGDCLFSDGENPSLLDIRSRDGRHKVPEVVKRVLQPQSMRFSNVTETSSKDGLTIICSRRGGNVLSKSHSAWLQTVSGNPEAICFKFVPITSLLTGIPGSGYLSHAINLYLRYKPSREDLQCFLEFQVPQQWAPTFCELPLRHERRNTTRASLQFSFMGPKILVSSSQVCSEKKPVLGLRLFLEGKKSNGLGIHLQHLSSMPNIMTCRSSFDPSSTTRKPCQWRGSNDYESSPKFLEPVNWKRYSKVCSTVVKHDPKWIQETSGVFIVTGAQLVCSKSILHLRLLFTHIPNCSIRKTEWVSAPPADSRKANILSNLSTTFTFLTANITDAPPKQHKLESLNSGVYSSGPPVPVRSKKFLKYVETAEVVRGPHDTPGHWLVTAAKLVSENGKIGLHVKFALLEY